MRSSRIHHTIAHLRAKPVHIRRKIALGASAGVTALVALGWVVALGTSHALQVGPSVVAENTQNPKENVAQSFSGVQNGFTQLLGAAGAAKTGQAPSSGLVTVSDVASSTSHDSKTTEADATVIHF